MLCINPLAVMTMKNVADLVLAARAGRRQRDFADLLGVDQSSVSRYERGMANPPQAVINQCMQMVHSEASGDAPTAEQLAERVRAKLAGPEHAEVRGALFLLMDAI